MQLSLCSAERINISTWKHKRVGHHRVEYASTSQLETTGNELVTTESNGVSAEDASFQGSTNAKSTQVHLISTEGIL